MKKHKTLQGHTRQGFLGGPSHIKMSPELETEFEQDRKEFYERMNKRIKSVGGWEQFIVPDQEAKRGKRLA
jgi:hypothetical protein